MSSDFITEDTFICDTREVDGVTEVLIYRKDEDKFGKVVYLPWAPPLTLVAALDLARSVSHCLGGLPSR